MANQEAAPLVVNGKPRFYYGYIIVAAAGSTQLIFHGIINTFGIFFKPLLAEFGWSRATLSGASSISFLIIGSVSILVGGLIDRVGPRIVMVVCGLFFGTGIFLMSQVHSIWQLYLFFGVIVGIGLSAGDVIPLSITARWFVKKRGMMSGIVKVGTGMGMFIMPLVASGLIATYSWRTSYVILGVLALVSLVALAQLMRRDPSQMQQLPDGEEQITADSVNSIGGGLSLQEAVHTRQFWTFCAVFLVLVFASNTILIHIVPHARDTGISALSAATILSVLGGVSIVGRLVMGGSGDRIGNKLALIICFAILLVTMLWLQIAGDLWMFYLFAAIYGFAHGGFFALVSPTVAELFGIRAHGMILGIVLFSGTIGGGIGSVLAGYIFDITNSYQMVFLILAVLSITGLILTTGLRPISVGGDE